MEKKMENEMESEVIKGLHTLNPRDPSIQITQMMGNQMEKKMENDMESEVEPSKPKSSI